MKKILLLLFIAVSISTCSSNEETYYEEGDIPEVIDLPTSYNIEVIIIDEHEYIVVGDGVAVVHKEDCMNEIHR